MHLVRRKQWDYESVQKVPSGKRSLHGMQMKENLQTPVTGHILPVAQPLFWGGCLILEVARDRNCALVTCLFTARL